MIELSTKIAHKRCVRNYKAKKNNDDNGFFKQPRQTFRTKNAKKRVYLRFKVFLANFAPNIVSKLFFLKQNKKQLSNHKINTFHKYLSFNEKFVKKWLNYGL